MKNLFKKMWVNKTLTLFLIFFIITFPTAIYQKSEFEKRAILTSIGIDKTDGKYEFSGLVVIEEDPMKISSNVKLVSSEGENISEAVYKLSITLGKEIGLAHCDSIVVGEGLNDENLADILDYFIRTSNLTKNTNLISCPGSAKELLQVNTENKDENGITFAKLVSTGSDYLAIVEMNIEDFYARYFTKSPVAWMTRVMVEEEQPDSGSQSSQGSGGQSGDSSQGGSSQQSSSGGDQSQTPKKKIKCDGSFAMYKKGKKAFTLEGDEANVINLLNPYTQKGFLTIDNVYDEGEFKESMGLHVVKKDTGLKYYFDKGVATLDINFKMYVELVELHTAAPSLKTIDVTRTHIGDNVKKAITDKMTENLNKVIEKTKEKKVDILAINDRLYKFQNKNYIKFVSPEERENNYIENVKVNLRVDVQPKL